jgi:hypothetical protein
MFSSNLTKFFIIFATFFLLSSACRYWESGNSGDPSPTPFVSDELQSEIPFATKEPEQFQTEIVVSANGTERKTFVARNGTKRRYDFNFGAKNQVINLQTDKIYLILPEKKIYAESDSIKGLAEVGDWSNFLTTEWLSEKRNAQFEKLETSENLTKYRVKLDESNISEIIISFDETLGLPVKQEFFSVDSEQRILNYAVELKNLRLQTDESLFAVPTDFKKVAAEELLKNV